MEVSVTKNKTHAVVIPVTDRLDGTVSPLLKSEMVKINMEGHKNIVLDLSRVRYCDSSGLSAILVGNRLCKNSLGSFVLCGLNDYVKKLIGISQLDSILNIAIGTEQAVAIIEKIKV